MKVYIDKKALLEVVADKEVGLYDIARLAKMSPLSVKRIFDGQAVLLKTASRLFNALGKDKRLQIWYDAPNNNGSA